MGTFDVRDPFFYKQPPFLFVEELKAPVHKEKPEWFNRTDKETDEADVREIYLDNQFTDPEGLLETVEQDFERFCCVYEIGGHSYPLRLHKGKTACFEAYTIETTSECCTVTANDTEGIRRAIYFLEDEMKRREGAFLPLGIIEKKPVIKSRITRGFFSPTYRPPEFIDELSNDMDYYPDEFLNRLAHDGSNGIWICTYFRDLVRTSVFPEASDGCERRIEKLRRVICKCKRYGIKVYIFSIEPEGLWPDLADKHPEIVGYNHHGHQYTLCTNTEAGERYCIESTQKLFEQLPDLGGVIAITEGERVSSCSHGDMKKCPRCGKYSKGEVLAHTIDLIKEGMRRAGTDAEFISWTYGHVYWDYEEIKNYVRLAPEDVMLLQNFEDRGYTEQLGKIRYLHDYWLSYTGPSDMFDFTAQAGLEYHKTIYAKMQVCCSHELASVPYIPVPGILYDKFSYCVKNGVKGVMECWLFGNYPCMNSKTAGEMAFTNNCRNKREFLEYLAGIYYGRTKAAAVADAWNLFEEGYSHFPANVMFGYYGPMHDGVVWELALKPRNNSLSRNWMRTDPANGDRISECLQQGHTLDEAVILTKIMCDKWIEGMKLLPKTGCDDIRSVSTALEILLSSGYNILRFYQLREQLLDWEGDCKSALQEMKEIVNREIINSSRMIAAFEKDSRLGFNSHADGYKFFPEKLSWRIERLKELLKTEFPEVEDRLQKGERPLDYSSIHENSVYRMASGGLEYAVWKTGRDKDKSSYRIAYDKENLYVELKGRRECEFTLCFEYRMMWASPTLRIHNGGLQLRTFSHESAYGDKLKAEMEKYRLEDISKEDTHYILKVSREKCGWTKDVPLKLKLTMNGVPVIEEKEPITALGKEDKSPGGFELLLPHITPYVI